MSSRACFSDLHRRGLVKGVRLRSQVSEMMLIAAEIAAIAETRCGWGSGLRPVHCHPRSLASGWSAIERQQTVCSVTGLPFASLNSNPFQG